MVPVLWLWTVDTPLADGGVGVLHAHPVEGRPVGEAGYPDWISCRWMTASGLHATLFEGGPFGKLGIPI